MVLEAELTAADGNVAAMHRLKSAHSMSPDKSAGGPLGEGVEEKDSAATADPSAGRDVEAGCAAADSVELQMHSHVAPRWYSTVRPAAACGVQASLSAATSSHCVRGWLALCALQSAACCVPFDVHAHAQHCPNACILHQVDAVTGPDGKLRQLSPAERESFKDLHIMLAKPSVRYRKTINTEDFAGRPVGVIAQQVSAGGTDESWAGLAGWTASCAGLVVVTCHF